MGGPPSGGARGRGPAHRHSTTKGRVMAQVTVRLCVGAEEREVLVDSLRAAQAALLTDAPDGAQRALLNACVSDVIKRGRLTAT